MKTEYWERVRRVSLAAMERPPSQRADFLEGVFAFDPSARQDVERLIESRERGETVTDPDVDPVSAKGGPCGSGPSPTRPQPIGVSELPSEAEQIGPYYIRQEIAHGGMGVVYLAEQVEPVRRQVALKLIKVGMDTREVIARFDAERQALALMSHPNIAMVFDAGATPQGRPYFAMEYVPGLPITQYCDRHRLRISERLELFIQVCEGVQHAHQKGIIHRDLKPSNVLVTTRNEKPIPKIIDFGIAKATSLRLTEQTLFTELGQLVGTPAYMSPEQADVTGHDIDTRSDVYSLGALLYELLVGAQPFEAKELRKAGLDELRRKIREEEPMKPSTRLEYLGTESRVSAERRSTDIRLLGRQLREDLDWITMRALEKDRVRRYASPAELAMDVRRHLKHEPVTAGQPSRTYRVGRFVRRHRLGVAAACFAAAALCLGTAGVTLGLIRARQAERKANTEAETARQALEFLVGVFKVSDPSEALGNTVTARQLLDEGAKRIEEELKDQPKIQATLLDTMGRAYQSLGLYDRARPLLEGARSVRQERFGNQSLETAESMNHLASLLTSMGDYVQAAELYREALRARRALLDSRHPQVSESLNDLATVLFVQGDYAAAEPLFRDALANYRGRLGEESLEFAVVLNNLAMTLSRQEKYEEAEPLYRESLNLHRRLYGAEHPAVAQKINNVGMFLLKKGDVDAATSLLREALQMNRRLLGDEHPEVATGMNNLAMALRESGEYEEAKGLFRQALEMSQRLLGRDHPYVAKPLSELAILTERAGQHAQAVGLYREALRVKKLTFPADHWEIAVAESQLGGCLVFLERYEEAERLLIDNYARIEAHFSTSHEKSKDARNRITNLYRAWGKPEKAATWGAPDRTTGDRSTSP